jgi:DNA-3-methyladenine glycosylase
MPVITREFYDRSALEVARDLLGCRLVRHLDGVRMAGLILESEAYQGEADLGCHASSGRTPRTMVMYGPPGHAYVYFTYGLHWLLNAVTGGEGTPAAVLIRALQPEEGMELMAKNRPFRAMKPGWTDGPAKLTQALGITGDLNSVDLCDQASGLWIESGATIPNGDVLQTARVGLNSVPEPWKSIPWRFVVDSRRSAVDVGGIHGS